VVTGRLLPELDLDSPQVRDLLAGWQGSHSARSGEYGWEVLLFEPAERGERWWLHGLLFLVTLFSTTVAGSLLAGHPPLRFLMLPAWLPAWLPVPVSLDPAALATGLPFGISLVVILALHEAGHYVAAKRHGISVTPPFFIPFPPYVSVIGTLGAFIRLRSPVMSRNALLDVGIAGPLLSFVASIPLLWWGLVHSSVLATKSAVSSPYVIVFTTQSTQDLFLLGESAAMWALNHLLIGFDASGQVLELHPVAFAGWLGLFVTALNLLPLAQLDGGHILYAALGARQKPLAWAFFLTLIPLGFLWAGWWVWAVLVLVVGRGRIRHPSLFNAEQGLTPGRHGLALLAAILFAVCFVPVPFQI
jgi:membrane-associated protease RseP (regulator of RpoE activity)